jgi:hypothetical protein
MYDLDFVDCLHSDCFLCYGEDSSLMESHVSIFAFVASAFWSRNQSIFVQSNAMELFPFVYFSLFLQFQVLILSLIILS